MLIRQRIILNVSLASGTLGFWISEMNLLALAESRG